MTLEEKVSLCSGQNFWQTKDLSPDGLPALFMSDGSHGLRKQEIKTDGSGMDMMGIHDSLPATCFPTAVTSGSSWDESLMERIGAAIGEEARGYEVGLVLGPGVNIKRNPLCGRNFEYISEDPYVSGKMAAAHIRGLQKKRHWRLPEALRMQQPGIVPLQLRQCAGRADAAGDLSDRL